MFCVFGSEVLDESGKSDIRPRDCVKQTRPVALVIEFDGGPCAAWESLGTRLNFPGFLDFIDADYGGIHLLPLCLNSW